MDFRLTADQRALRSRVREFARTCLGTTAAESDESARLPLKEWRECARFGILGWPIPPEYGGAGLDPFSIAIGLEALGYGCRDNGLVFAIGNQLWACAVHILAHGTEEQKQRFLPGLADGSLVGSQALTEPDAGSDVMALSTTAQAVAGGYALNGTKTFISNAVDADVFIVFARTAQERSQSALTAFLVPRGTAGLEVTGLSKPGVRATSMGRVLLRDCRVPAEAILGGIGGGYGLFTSGIEWERIFMFAPQVGALEWMAEDAAAYAGSRRQFGRPIGSYQAVSHKIADMRIRAELSRLALYRAAWLKGEGRVALLESAIAKLYISESAVASSLDAQQVYGARGYVSEYGIEREVRDALAGRIYAGTSDIQRNIIATLIGVPTGD
ncbi:alkylation response protein AidB-like acyl-CoA dehydrogenase [Catenulispora sp. EB89]|uniref:acyl-CoA dehydrogenase family protein n=1 Tax=Catenulispora sp. EB89 TaxID=3156257 RepID=UPI0035138CB4